MYYWPRQVLSATMQSAVRQAGNKAVSTTLKTRQNTLKCGDIALAAITSQRLFGSPSTRPQPVTKAQPASFTAHPTAPYPTPTVSASINNGKGEKLGLTGNLGDVMKESATIALQYLKEHCDLIGITPEFFETHNIHIHVPEGATPKDGPSAGITIATSLASAITKRKVRKNIAMTGEITLRGKVLPVGGIKEKILAAKRAGITDILICHENKKNIEDIPAKYVKGVTFHYVENVKDVLDFALL